jgi:hypothetical protein
MAARTTARMTAFIPEQSPPLVNTAIRFMSVPLEKLLLSSR